MKYDQTTVAPHWGWRAEPPRFPPTSEREFEKPFQKVSCTSPLPAKSNIQKMNSD